MQITLPNLNQRIIRPALAWMPPNFRGQAAERMLAVIALQESGLRHRVQLVGGAEHWWQSDGGPARGLWQFEYNGVAAVLSHDRVGEPAREFAGALLYPVEADVIHHAITHNDLLACVFARLLLYTVPEGLPAPGEVDRAWEQYTWAWRPGKPHRGRWDENWSCVNGE